MSQALKDQLSMVESYQGDLDKLYKASKQAYDYGPSTYTYAAFSQLSRLHAVLMDALHGKAETIKRQIEGGA